jgi:DNA-binding MarR family transcriptional regulator
MLPILRGRSPQASHERAPKAKREAPGTSTGLSLERFMPYRLSYSANLVSEAIAQQYSVIFNLTIPEWRVVAHVAEQSGITQQEIGLRTRMDKVTVSRATIALAARGFVSRNKNPADRRSRLLSLTAAGQRLYAATAPRALELERAVFGQFSAAEMTAFRGFLQRVDAAASAAMTAESEVAATIQGV